MHLAKLVSADFLPVLLENHHGKTYSFYQIILSSFFFLEKSISALIPCLKSKIKVSLTRTHLVLEKDLPCRFYPYS